MTGTEPYLPYARALSSGSLLTADAERGGNPIWDEACLRVLVMRLSSFPDVSRSSPHLFLFSAAREAAPDAFVDMAFLSSPRDRSILAGAGLNPEFGIYSGAAPREFDVILISNSYSLELLNLAPFLGRSGIPASIRERRGFPRTPLLILGGSNASAAYALYEDPCFGRGECLVDAVFFGEGEGRVQTIVRALSAEKTRGQDFSGEKRGAVLEAIGDLSEGLHVPGSEKPVEQAFARMSEIDSASLLESSYPPLNSSEASTLRLTISRGCPSFCTFCMEGWDRKPYREIPSESLISMARAAKRSLGADTVELSSFTFNAHPGLSGLFIELNRLFMNVNPMSQRADLLMGVPGLIALEFAGDKRSFTLGVEGISERMRSSYAKGLSASTLTRLLDRLLDARAREIKLFYVLSGDETEDDINEFGGFMEGLKQARSSRSPGTRLLCSAGYLVRMPGTPLEADQALRPEAIFRAISVPIRSACESNGVEFRLASDYNEYALNQLLVTSSVPGYRLLLGLAEKGLEHPGQLPAGALDAALSLIEENGSRASSSDPGSHRPFSFLKRSVDPGFVSAFASGLGKREKSEDGPSCLGSSCLGCGACTDEGSEREALVGHAIPDVKQKTVDRLSLLMKEKSNIRPLGYWIDVPGWLSGAESEFLSSWAMRAVFTAFPDQAENLLMTKELLFTKKPGSARIGSFSGKTLFGFWAWDGAALASALERFSDWTPLGEVLPASPALDPIRFSATLITPVEGRRAMEDSLRAYLDEATAPYVLSRPDGGFSLVPSEKGLKKRIISAASLEGENGPRVSSLRFKIGALRNFDFKRILALYAEREKAPAIAPRLAVDAVEEIERKT